MSLKGFSPCSEFEDRLSFETLIADLSSKFVHLPAEEVEREIEALQACLASLTQRQREVMKHIVAGQLNKQVAFDLGTGEQNIKPHRAHIMRKMGTGSLADLVRIAELSA